MSNSDSDSEWECRSDVYPNLKFKIGLIGFGEAIAVTVNMHCQVGDSDSVETGSRVGGHGLIIQISCGLGILGT